MTLINNRQNGRRRGRGGQQTRNGQPGNPHSNSRVDNRQRGNAAQLFEKYKTLARDAQMQGDRVNTEYYLQFADHYFRVLSESRSRYEEQRRPRDESGQEFGAEDDGDAGQRGYAPRDFSEDGWDDGEDEREQDVAPQHQPQNQPQNQPQRAAPNQPQGNRRPPYPPRANGHGGNANGNGGMQSGEAMPAARGGNGFSAAPDRAPVDAAPDRIAIELPPPLAAQLDDVSPAPLSAEGEEPVAAPKRRRGRKPKAADAPQADA